MNAFRLFFTLMLCIVCDVRGDTVVRSVWVGGDVPKPGPVKFEDEGMTIDTVMAGVGMDLSPFYAEGGGGNVGSKCPIRVIIFRDGDKITYDPSVNSAVLRTLPIKLGDAISVMNFRQHPKKIENRKQRIERMLELGSTEIANELLALATLLHEYDEWRGEAGATAKEPDHFLRKEAARLVSEGKGNKIIGILDLRLSAFQLDGLGHAHPLVNSTTNLIHIFRELVAE